MSLGESMARFKQFPRTFWVINGIELLERGAYYSLSALFTVFMLGIFRADGMGEGEAAALAGSLGSLLFLLLYAVPLVAAALAEKFGYKASLAVCFALLLSGYVVATFSTSLPLIFTTVVLVGFGAGIFKPIAAALVSQTSSEENRNFAFTIYYGCINLGAFVFPLGVGLVGLMRPGDTDFLARIAFGTAAALTAANLLLSLFVFRNLRAPQKDTNVLKALKSLGDVFKAPSFLILLVIYSGFWFMYAMNLTFITAYMVDFGRMPTWFNTALLQAINPLVIILAAPFIGALTTRFNSLALMIVGITMYALGLLTLGWSTTGFVFVTGIFIFSVGELLTHPSYLSYVSKLAPPEKVSVYLGYGFIPIAVGLFLGSSIGGGLYGLVAREGGQPNLFWAYISAVGLATVAALVIYNMVLTTVRERQAGAPKPSGRTRTLRYVGAPVAALLAILLIPAMIGGATITGTTTTPVTPLNSADLATIALDPVEDVATEGEPTQVAITLPDNATGNATLKLTWTDEAAAGPGATNAPDSFTVHVVLPDGAELESEASDTGELTFEIPAIAGAYTIHVSVDAGDHTVNVGPIPVPGGVGGSVDSGNAFTLEVSHQASA